MTSGNTPCYRPSLCGVKSHRPGTDAKCHNSQSALGARIKARLDGTYAGANASYAPSSQDESPEFERLAGLSPTELYIELNTAGVNFSEQSDRGKVSFHLEYQEPEKGQYRRIGLEFDDDNNLKTSSLDGHPEFSKWYAEATGNEPQDPAITTGSPEERAAAVYKHVLDGERVDIVTKDSVEGGTQSMLSVNYNRSKGNMYDSTDNPVVAKIKTASGVIVYAGDFGAQGEYTYADGDTIKSWVHPMSLDEEDMSSKISSDEFMALQEANNLAYFVGWSEEVTGGEELTSEEMDQKVIRRALENQKQ